MGRRKESNKLWPQDMREVNKRLKLCAGWRGYKHPYKGRKSEDVTERTAARNLYRYLCGYIYYVCVCMYV